jgi:RNA polymerase sigma factor (sigma-70 family)
MTTTSSTAPQVQDEIVTAYLRHWRSLLAMLRRRVGSQELAEDALQETWLRLSTLSPQTPPIADHRAFILRVAGNIAIDLARREKRHTGGVITDDMVLNAIADTCPSPETIIIDRDQLRFLVLALTKLAPKPRAALLFNRCDGMSHREIAGRLKVSESMVARYLAQALRHCRDFFRDER